MHKKSDVYKMYLEKPYICFGKQVAIFRAFLSRELQELFNSIIQ